MLRILLHIFRRKHITNADLKRAIENARRTQTDNQPKIIEYQDLTTRKQDTTEQPKKEEN